MDQQNQMTLERFFFVVRKRIALILVISIAAAAAVGAIGSILMVPEYSSTVTFYVNVGEQQNATSVKINQSDLTVAKSLVSTYIVIIKSDTALEEVAEEAGISYTTKELEEHIETAQIGDTEVFSVTATDTDPKVAYSIAKAVEEVAPKEIIRIVDAGDVTIIDQPKEPREPDPDNLMLMIGIGFFVGFVVSFVVFFLVEVLDVTVYSEEDLTENFDYPILGSVPRITTKDEQSKVKKRKKGAVK